MPNDYAYTNLGLNGRFSEDGEYFQLFLQLNGVPIRFGNIYVGDQREAFQAAHDAGQTSADSADTTAAN